MRNPGNFSEKYGPWAVVAGGSEGLGAAFAKQLAARGMNLLLLARREELLQETAGRLASEYPVKIHTLVLDLADTALDEIIREATRELEVGVLIYNAAFIPIGAFIDSDLDLHQQVIDVNVRGPLILLHALLGPMRERQRGAVVLMSSMGGIQGLPGLSVYSATKAFNTMFAEGLWYELRQQGIDVLACCAGATRTPAYFRSFGKAVPGMLESDVVARKTLSVLGKGPRVVPGFINRIVAFINGRLLSRKAAIRLVARTTWRNDD